MSKHVKSVKLPLGLRLLRQLPIPHKLGVLERLYGRTLLQHGTQWVKCSNGVEWKLDLRSPEQRWIVYGDYEGPIQLRWMRQWMREGGVYLDSGANIGQMLLYIAPLPNVQAIAFEPLPEAAAWLTECLEHYQNSWHAQIIPKGLAEQTKQINFQRAGAHSTIRMDWYQRKHHEIITIEVDTLDNQLENLSLNKVRLWKIDVEGTEIDVLRGAEKSLKQALVDAILIEICAPNLPVVKTLLTAAGYQLLELNSSGHLVAAPAELSGTTNLVALSPHSSKSIHL